MKFDSNLTDQEQKELFSEVEPIFKEKVSNKFAFLGCQYIPREDGMINTLYLNGKHKDKNFAGFQIVIKSLEFIQTEDKIAVKLQNGVVINSSCKAFIHYDFDNEIPAVTYIFFFDIDEYRIAKNNFELEHQTIQ